MTALDYEKEDVVATFNKLQEFIAACEMRNTGFRKMLSDRVAYLHNYGYDKEDREVRDFLSAVLEFILGLT